MDKLEKALLKARQARQDAAPESRGNDRSTAVSDLPVAPRPPEKTSSDMVVNLQLEQSRVVAHRTRHQDADTFRILRTQVLQAMAQSGLRSLAITSPHYGDGKTTIACNLALSIVQDVKQTVLLVDLDLRKPDLHRYMGLPAPFGLTDYLMDRAPLEDCLVRPPFERLSILPAGQSLDNSSEVLASPRMAALARQLEREYDDRLVIYDMPPLLDQDDSMAFFPHVGSVLMVVRDAVTSVADVKRAMSALSATHLIGTVLNRATR